MSETSVPPIPPPEPLPNGSKNVRPATMQDRLAMVLQLERRARTADAEELPFILVNETRQLLPYRQAVMFSFRMGRLALNAVSGLAVPDSSAPYAHWMEKFAAWGSATPGGMELRQIDLAKITGGPEATPEWLSDWPEWVPPHVLWAPLTDGKNAAAGVLAFFREEPFAKNEIAPLSYLAESYAQSLALAPNAGKGRGRVPFRWALLALLPALALFIPIRQTVLAPAEVSARRSAVVRSGLDGVVDRLLVEPNQKVEKNDNLIKLEDSQLRTRLAVAKKAEDMAAAEYRQLLQAGLSDPKAKQRLPLVLGRMEQLAAETAYAAQLMERVVIASPIKGVVLCDNPDEWLGRPVSLGQRILLVADPEDVELEIRLPASEALHVEIGDALLFYPNVTPISPLPAKMTFVGYRAGDVPGIGMAFILRADFPEGEKPLLGLRGMAKLYGPPQALGLILLRTPIQAVRQWLGI